MKSNDSTSNNIKVKKKSRNGIDDKRKENRQMETAFFFFFELEISRFGKLDICARLAFIVREYK